ncbi:unnamed protein product, partial [Ectocarpus sp. 8 AP-2014]
RHTDHSGSGSLASETTRPVRPAAFPFSATSCALSSFQVVRTSSSLVHAAYGTHYNLPSNRWLPDSSHEQHVYSSARPGCRPSAARHRGGPHSRLQRRRCALRRPRHGVQSVHPGFSRKARFLLRQRLQV